MTIADCHERGCPGASDVNACAKTRSCPLDTTEKEVISAKDRYVRSKLSRGDK